MTDFIDRAKLEAEARDYADVGGPELDAEAQKAFLAGAAAYAALLDAEMAEEWGVRSPSGGIGRVGVHPNEAHNYADQIRGVAISRRVLYGPWLPSEGDEKP